MRPELPLVVESPAVARKKPGRAVRGRCDSFVVETSRALSQFGFTVPYGVRCLIRRRASGGGTGWEAANTGSGQAGEGGVRCARHGEASRRLRRWRRIWGCAGIWSSGPKGPSRHWSKGVEEAECRLIRQTRTPDSTGVYCRESGFLTRRRCSPSSSRHALDLGGGPAGWGLPAGRGPVPVHPPSQAVVEGRRRGGRGADDRGDPSAVPRSADASTGAFTVGTTASDSTTGSS